MRKLLLALAAIATIGIAVPAATSQADARTVIIKKGGHHHGGWHRHAPRKVVVIKHRR